MHLMNTSINKLNSLRVKVGNQSPEGRIDFMLEVYSEPGLFADIHAHQLHEDGISSRDIDTCFEMGDGRDVLLAIMAKAVNDPVIEQNIRDEGLWDSWLEQMSGAISLFQ